MPESRDPEILRLARAMMDYHGGRDALAFAQRALANVRHLNMREMIEHWEHVSAAIREITADQHEKASRRILARNTRMGHAS